MGLLASLETAVVRRVITGAAASTTGCGYNPSQTIATTRAVTIAISRAPRSLNPHRLVLASLERGLDQPQRIDGRDDQADRCEDGRQRADAIGADAARGTRR